MIKRKAMISISAISKIPVRAKASKSLQGPLRSLSVLCVRVAKNDTSTIDSYRLPSQTSINEWEFKYDFVPKILEPKVPPVTTEAIQQEKAEAKKQEVEKELLNKELNFSIKVEANDANVVHGGESVGAEPVLLQDRGSDPVDAHVRVAQAFNKKRVDSTKYQQLSLNQNINSSEVVNLGHNTTVDHNSGDVDVPPEIHDAEEAEQATAKPPKEQQEATSGSNVPVFLAVLGLGGVVGYLTFGVTKEK